MTTPQDDELNADDPNGTQLPREHWKLDALKHISQVHRGALQERFKQEWRILLSVATFYATAIYAVLQTKPRISPAVVWGVFVAIAGMSTWALVNLHNGNRKNRNFVHRAEGEIERILEVPIFRKTSDKLSQEEPFPLVHLAWQALLIILLGGCLAHAICQIPPE